MVLQQAMAKPKRAALSRVVIARREHAVALMPMGRGLVAHALLEQRDLADPKGVFDRSRASTPSRTCSSSPPS